MIGCFEAASGYKLNENTGLVVEHPSYMATKIFYRAHKGDRIRVKNDAFAMAVATYSDKIPQQYMYTYTYADEQNWSTYQGDFSENSFTQSEKEFNNDCWFRVCVKRLDGIPCSDNDARQINNIIEYIYNSEEIPDNKIPVYYLDEIKVTAEEASKKVDKEKSLVFCLLSDSHCTVNGTWHTTMKNIKLLSENIKLDGIIHLGDLQDGMLDKEMCRRITKSCIDDMCRINSRLYLAIGNHDTNYFHENPEWLTVEEQYDLYGKFNDLYVNREGINGYYYVDFENVKLRMIVLTSFDRNQKLRYGFSDEEVEWVRKTLTDTSEGYKVMVLSHDAPLARLDYWASEIRNGDRLMEILEAFHNESGKEILAFIHGHTHADFVYNERSFPIISIGCSKIEYFPDKKPEGAVRYMRKLDDLTQELWDVLIVTPEKRELNFVRFGAGEDRTIRDGEVV